MTKATEQCWQIYS